MNGYKYSGVEPKVGDTVITTLCSGHETVTDVSYGYVYFADDRKILSQDAVLLERGGRPIYQDGHEAQVGDHVVPGETLLSSGANPAPGVVRRVDPSDGNIDVGAHSDASMWWYAARYRLQRRAEVECPPLGVKPRWLVDEQRLKDLREAVQRNPAPLKEWLDEIAEIEARMPQPTVFGALHNPQRCGLVERSGAPTTPGYYWVATDDSVPWLVKLDCVDGTNLVCYMAGVEMKLIYPKTHIVRHWVVPHPTKES